MQTLRRWQALGKFSILCVPKLYSYFCRLIQSSRWPPVHLHLPNWLYWHCKWGNNNENLQNCHINCWNLKQLIKIMAFVPVGSRACNLYSQKLFKLFEKFEFSWFGASLHRHWPWYVYCTVRSAIFYRCAGYIFASIFMNAPAIASRSIALNSLIASIRCTFGNIPCLSAILKVQYFHRTNWQLTFQSREIVYDANSWAILFVHPMQLLDRPCNPIPNRLHVILDPFPWLFLIGALYLCKVLNLKISIRYFEWNIYNKNNRKKRNKSNWFNKQFNVQYTGGYAVTDE